MKPFSIFSLFCLTGVTAVSALLFTMPLAAQTLNNTFGGLSESSGEPIDIESDTLTIFTDDYALFSGNVKAVQGTTTLRARELKVHYVGGGDTGGANNEAAKQPTAGGAPAAGSASGSSTNNEGGVSTKPAEAEAADAQRTIDDPIDIESDWLLVHDEEKYAHFRGNVRVVRGDTKLRSKELTVNFGGGDSLSVAAETNDGGAPGAQITKIEARGDVRALLSPKESKAAETAKSPAETSPGDAATHGSTPASKATYEMAQNTAPNSGAPKPSSAGNDAAAAKASQTATNENRQITKLEATGQVVITSEKDETSTSDWAIYDMPSELVTIGGNVVLTQNETVLKGDRLVIDLRTGESRFENTGTAATGGRRIRALFMPKEDGAKPRAKANKPAGEGGSAADNLQAPDTPPIDDTEPLPLVPEFR